MLQGALAARLGARLLAVDAASERGLELVDQAGLSTRPARAPAGVQALVQALVVVRGKEGGPAEQRATFSQTVSANVSP